MSPHTRRSYELPAQARRDAFRDLCADFDPLLRPGAGVDPSVRNTLDDFAKILDLPIASGATEGDIWRQVRPLLAGQMDDLLRVDGEKVDAAKVFLPVTPGLRDVPFSKAPPALSLLVVEDDPELAAGVVEVLTDAGHRVVAVASTAEQAATLAALHPIDFAIVDVELKGEADGVGLADQLKERWAVPVLFVSGGANEHLVDHHAALGFIGKPFNGAELLAAVTMAAGALERSRD